MLFATLNPAVLRIGLLLAVALSFFYNLHAVPLFDLDEGAFSESTREMFERGDFISPYLNGEPRYDKPILIYWLQAASVATFGVNEFAFRLPSALAGSLWVWAVVAFTRRIAPLNIALLAGIITATSLMVSVMAKAATADAVLNLLIASSLFCIYLFWRERRRGFLYAVFILMGLGFLTKGPVAVMIPLVVSLIFFTLKGEWRLWLRTAFNPAGIALFVLIAAPWYVVQYIKEGEAFLQGFFFQHNVSRFQSGMEGHTGNVFYYLPVLFLAVLPYSVVLLKAVGQGRRWWREDFWLFVLIWSGFVLVFFSLSATKLPHYLLYGLSGLFVLMAMVLGEMRSRVWLYVPQIVFFGFLAALPELIEYLQPSIEDTLARAALDNAPAFFTPLHRALCIAAIVISLVLMALRVVRVEYKMLVSGLLVVFLTAAYLLPLIGHVHQAPLRDAALLAKREGFAVVMWKLNMPSFSVYREQVTPRRAPRAGEIVVTKAQHLGDLPGYELLYQDGGIALARVVEEQGKDKRAKMKGQR